MVKSDSFSSISTSMYFSFVLARAGRKCARAEVRAAAGALKNLSVDDENKAEITKEDGVPAAQTPKI